MKEEQFIIFCHCVRPTTGTEMTIPLPPEVTPETVVDYIGNEFDWMFIPMGVQVVPVDDLRHGPEYPNYDEPS
ncbi:hypothetical protein [uncultured Limnobacter sp.]|uniref:hypothetical protein n=1 Tax=uncultured Limnobacter sp. TaxID=199681 RepID=UPI0032B243F6|tara:strand:- start:128 stop:346 length:219 start_codon:yes stop_codon:yes gene_type:complete